MKVCINKIKGLLIPLFSFSIVSTIFCYIVYKYPISVNNLFENFFCWNWYLISLLFCILSTCLINKVIKKDNNQILCYFLVFILSFFIPNKMYTNVHLSMYPYFIIGYLISKHYDDRLIKINQKRNIRNLLIFISFISFILLLRYQNDFFVYSSGLFLFGQNSIVNQLIINFGRILLSLSGCYITYYMWSKFISHLEIKHNRFFNNCVDCISKIGKMSLGIYLLNGYFVISISKFYKCTNSIISIIISILIVIFAYFLTRAIRRNKILNFVLFASR